MYSLSYYIPPDAHERVMQALFACGAGKIGHYDECCWEVLGHGQFRAQTGSKPAVGKIDQLEKLTEYKVEMVCEEQYIHKVVETLLREHPYEQPAYFFRPVMTLSDL
ncbi:MAG: NGG1p interacting factor NIF3 [gamma proteobacterium symbiont of Lucinoma myriamae]|nr:NGG1p interacting factor NIF3 [gamma proteobacterium symbiont of Lucinoma myriamae]MCU7833557.1 NGG1p interacting factor NIF3 [gamma proteobacterium symbiont of Lucinoma myriamae]